MDPLDITVTWLVRTSPVPETGVERLFQITLYIAICGLKGHESKAQASAWGGRNRVKERGIP